MLFLAGLILFTVIVFSIIFFTLVGVGAVIITIFNFFFDLDNDKNKIK